MATDTSQPTRILILGAGFGGIYTYLSLHRLLHGRDDIEVVMISETDHFLFIPLLHEVATGSLLPSSVRQSVRTIPQCCLERFITGTVYAIDCDNKTVRYRTSRNRQQEAGLSGEVVSYDYLVSALGSDTDFFGTPGAEEHALPLKRLDHATAIKNRIIGSFEEATTLQSDEEKEARLRFVVVGGGPTGAELAAEIGDLLANEMEEAFPELSAYSSVVLIETSDRLVEGMDEWFSRRTKQILEDNLKVQVRLNTEVGEVLPTGISTRKTSNGAGTGDEFIYADTVVWAAGVRAQKLDITAQRGVSVEPHSNRIHVTDYLNMDSYPNVFVIGDQAWIENKETGQPYPMRAQFAVREGRVAARNIKHMIEGTACEAFQWRDKGFILSLGKGGALARLDGLHISGLLAWVMYRGAYLTKLLGIRTKLRTALEWILNYFGPRDISRL